MVENKFVYAYTQRDLLNEKYHYMYTPFEGRNFLRAYFDERRLAVARLLERRKDLKGEGGEQTAIAEEIRDKIAGFSEEGLSRPLRKRPYKVLPAVPGEGKFSTKAILLDLWKNIIYMQIDGRMEVAVWIDALVKRFEVTKRIYSSYNLEMRRLSDDCHSLAIYTLLASLLVFQYQATNNLKYLNALLKINDLLLSVNSDDANPFVELLLPVNLEKELQAIEKIAAEQQVLL